MHIWVIYDPCPYPNVVGVLRAWCWWWLPSVRKRRPGRGWHGGCPRVGCSHGACWDVCERRLCPWQPPARLWWCQEYHHMHACTRVVHTRLKPSSYFFLLKRNMVRLCVSLRCPSLWPRVLPMHAPHATANDIEYGHRAFEWFKAKLG
jgi:hypothetical protein